MMAARKRYGMAFAVSAAVHAALLLALGPQLLSTQREPVQIMEVTLAAGQPPQSRQTAAPQAAMPESRPEKAIPSETTEQASLPSPDKDAIPTEKPLPTQSANPAPAATTTTTKVPAPSAGEADKETATAGNGNNDDASEARGVPATPPRIVSSPKPSYPSGARSNGIEGTTFVKVLVDADGRVEESFVASGSGNEALDNAAVNILYKWRFAPAKDSFGEPCPCYITIPIIFTLR